MAQTAPEATPSQATASPSESPALSPAGLAPTPSEPTLGAPSAASANNDFLPNADNTVKFYTITASLREIYDDNIFTTRTHKTGSPKTEFSPSLLLDLPLKDAGTLTMRLTFGVDYYELGRHNDPYDYTGQILLHYNRNFSSRFSLDVNDQGGYYTEPDLLNAIGTPFRDGSYFENSFTAEFDAQWTPLFGSNTSFTNVAILYDNEEIAQFQNEDENTLTHDFSFAIYPKYNLTAGFIFDDTDYFQSDRGYANTTLDVGVDWQALPNLSVAVRAGGSMTDGNSSGDSVSPYGSATLSWLLGKRSHLTLDYSHSVQPTDVINAEGQEADRFSVRFSYDVTSRINVHLSGTYTHSEYTEELLLSGKSFSEDDLGVDLGGSYRLDDHFSFEAGYTLSDISSEEEVRDYTRNQVYLGIRGTY